MALNRVVGLSVDVGNSATKLKEFERGLISVDNVVKKLSTDTEKTSKSVVKSIGGINSAVRALKDKSIKISVNKGQSLRTIEAISRAISKIASKSISLKVNSSQSVKAINSVSASINKLSNKKITLSANTKGAAKDIESVTKQVNLLTKALNNANMSARTLLVSVSNIKSNSNLTRLKSDIDALTNSLRQYQSTGSGVSGVTIRQNNTQQGSRALSNYSNGFNNVQRSANKAAFEVNAFNTAIGTLAAGFGIAELIRLTDTYTQIQNRLKLVTDSTEELAVAQQQVSDIAKETSSRLLGTADLYSKIARVSDKLSLSQQDVAETTATVAKAIAISGQGVQQAEAAVLQLGQALSSGRLQGDELRSLAENAAPLAQIIADFVPAADGSIGKLREFASTGQVTSEVVIAAIKAGRDSINADFANIDFTITQSLNNISNAAVRLTGEFGKLGDGQGGGLSSFINGIADGIDTLSENMEVVSTVLTGVAALAFGRITAAITASTAAAVKNAAANTRMAPAILGAARAQEAIARADIRRATAAAAVTRARLESNRSESSALQLQQRLVAQTNALTNANASLTNSLATQRQAMLASSVAARGLNTVMNALGGPVGIAITAASALAIYVSGLESAEEETGKLRKETKGLNDELKNLKIVEFTNKQIEVQDKLTAAKKKLNEQIALEKRQSAQGGSIGFTASGITDKDSVKVREYRAQVAILEANLDAIKNAFGSVAEKSTDYSDSLAKITGLTAKQLRFIELQSSALTKNSDNLKQAAEIQEVLAAAILTTVSNGEILNRQRQETKSAIDDVVSRIVTEGELNKEQIETNKKLIVEKKRLQQTDDFIAKQQEANSKKQLALNEQLGKSEEAKIQVTTNANKQKKEDADKQSRLNEIALKAIENFGKEAEATNQSAEALFIYRKTKDSIAKIERSTLSDKEMQIELLKDEARSLFLLAESGKQLAKAKKDAENEAKLSSMKIESAFRSVESINKEKEAILARTEAFANGIQSLELYNATRAAINDITESGLPISQQLSMIDDTLAAARESIELEEKQEEAINKRKAAIDRLNKSQEEANDLSGFGKTSSGITGALRAFAKLNKANKNYAEELKIQGKTAAQIKKSEDNRFKATISGYGDLISAGKGFFDEQSDGYKALEAVEQGFRAAEMVMAIQSLTTQAAAFFGVQTASTASTGVVVANEGVKSTAAGITAVATAAQSSPWTGIATAVAMAGLLAGFGVVLGGGGGASDVNISEDRQSSQGTGSVFGDADAKSESISNSLELMTDLQSDLLTVNVGMLNSLKNLSVNITSAGELILRRSDGSGIDSSLSGLGSSLSGMASAAVSIFNSSLGGMLDKLAGGMLSGITGKLAGGLFGKTTKSIADTGIGISAQPIEDIISKGIADAFSFATVQTKKKSWFKSSTSYSEVRGALDNATSTQFGLIITDVYESIVSAANTIYGGSSEALSRLNAASLPEQLVSLKGLTGEEQLAELESVFSNISDTLSLAAIPNLNEFANAGEGGLETLARMSAQVSILQSVAEMSRMSLIATGDDLLRLSDILADTSGGIDKLAENLNFYLENFLTDAEKSERIYSNLSESFISLSDEFSGFSSAVPKTKEAFRKVAESIDVGTESGAKLYASLIQLAPAFVSFIDSADETEGSLLNTREAYIDALEREQDTLLDTIDVFSEFSRELRQTARDLRIDTRLSGLSPEERLKALKTEFDSVANRAKLGDKDALGKLSGLSKEYLDASQAYYGVSENYFSDFNSVLGIIDDSADVADRQVTIAKSNLEVNKDILENLGVINSNLLSVEDALNNFISAGGSLDQSSEGVEESGDGSIIEQIYIDELGRPADSAGLNFWQSALDSGDESESSIANAIIEGAVLSGETTEVTSQSPSSGVSDIVTIDGLDIETNEGYLTLLYRRGLDREPDSGGFSFWLSALESGLSRGDLKRDFFDAAELSGEPTINRFATGGINIRGPGTGVSDSIPVRISNGESVMTASATRANASTLAAMNAGISLPSAIDNQTNAMIEQNAIMIDEMRIMSTKISQLEDQLSRENNAA